MPKKPGWAEYESGTNTGLTDYLLEGQHRIYPSAVSIQKRQELKKVHGQATTPLLNLRSHMVQKAEWPELLFQSQGPGTVQLGAPA